jgi:hypothetical protein
MTRDGYTVHSLPIPGHVRSVRVSAYVLPDGRPGLSWTGNGIGHGAYHVVELFGRGPNGGVIPFAQLSPSACRELATALEHAAVDLIAAERYARTLPPEPTTTKGAVRHV